MPTKAQFDELRAEMTDGLNNIADDITRLTDTMGTPGMSEADEAATLEEFRTLAQRIRDIAAVTPEAPTE